MEALRLIWDDAFLRYDFGPGHPMSPLRLELAELLIRELGLLAAPGVAVTGAELAPDQQLFLVH
ncbi:MAG: acetoin utilization protein AcuC, partial [Kineosporiaceae bacterium]